jgi:hypothetical protein
MLMKDGRERDFYFSGGEIHISTPARCENFKGEKLFRGFK